MADRDPRMQPASGDVLTNGRNTFYVTRVEGREVFYTEDHPPVPELVIDISHWQSYSKGDTVINRADHPADTRCAGKGEVQS